MPNSDVHVAIVNVSLPAGVAGPGPMEFDVRCFLVPHPDGLVLVDTGVAGSKAAIDSVLSRIGVTWGDITDVILSHHHPDHIGGLAEVAVAAAHARIWGSPRDTYPVPVAAATDGDVIRGVRVFDTPGHTPGHLSLLAEDFAVLLPGDLLGSTPAGPVRRAPAAFTADARQAERSLRSLTAIAAPRMLPSHGREITDPYQTLQRLLSQAPATG
jgi:glyoxylase-like metal-dependent hydrolase (beta-lactamase superfamily II)